MVEINNDVVPVETIKQNLEKIYDKIDYACTNSNRNAKDINLIVVTKNQSAQTLKNCIDCGLTNFGENRLNHLDEMISSLSSVTSTIPTWHFIGQLQSNKISKIISNVSYIHSVSKKSHIDLISDTQHPPKMFLQIYTGKNSNRAGAHIDDVPELINYSESKGNRFIGLMIMPDLDQDPYEQFSLAKVCADKNSLEYLSMGMSGDFETAIACGSTHIRLGSAIFQDDRK
ncbi:MAG: YggS family pyridoxal phosphate-dependent enzyme [Acidimicrobiia bacterium]